MGAGGGVAGRGMIGRGPCGDGGATSGSCLANVIGSVPLASRLSEDELQAALGPLVTAELLFQRGTPPAAIYRF